MVEVGAVRFEVRQVGLEKVQMLRVEGFEVTIQELAGNRLVKGLPQVVILLQHPRRDEGNPAIHRAWRHVKIVRRAGRILPQRGLFERR